MAIGNPISLTSNVATKTINVIATASQTSFTVTGGYRLNELSVFRNGVRLVNGRDFTARDGSIVTLLSAASEGDVLEFQVFDTFRVADAITPFDSAQTIAGDLSIVGVLSATTLGSVNFNLTSGIQTFHDVRVGGALTVAGSLTYEDTTNTNTVGLATFSGGMNISGVGATVTTLNVTGVSTFASNVSIADSIFHTGDTDTSIRFPAADTFTVETGGSERLRVDSSGRIGVGVVPTAQFDHNLIQIGHQSTLGANASLSATGQTFLTHNLYFDTGGTLKVFNTSNANEGAILQLADGSFKFSNSAATTGTPTVTERLRITSAGLVRVPDNGKFTTGDSDDLQIFHASGENFIRGNSSSSPLYIDCCENLNIRHLDTNGSNSETMIRAVGDGAVELYHDNSKKLETSATGVTVTGTLNATTALTQNGNALATNGKAIAMALIFG